MVQFLRRRCCEESGSTIVELLIAAVLSTLVAGAALDYYVNQHENWITQNNIAEAQQSMRACTQELSAKLRNAGAGLPEGLYGIWGSDSNPDTLVIRYSAAPMTLSVGDHTNKQQAVPIHVERYSILDGFNVGDRVYIYRPPSGPGEFFVITKLADNAGNGWKEVHHQGQVLNNDPMPGDIIVKLSENRYWVDNKTDTMHPVLMRAIDGVPQAYADEIYDLECVFDLIDGSSVTQLALGDTVVSVDFSLAAQTIRRDLTLAGSAGRLIRQASTRIALRNRPGAG